jgi:hypothetical protein
VKGLLNRFLARPMGLVNRVAQAMGMAAHLKMANSWRDHLNPLRGLTISKAIQYLEAGERGEYADLQWLYRFIEKTDATLIGLLERYDGKLVKLDWTIRTTPEKELPKGMTLEKAEAQAEYLYSVYDGIDNLRQAICFLIQARFRGYAHLQKIYGGDRQVPREDGDGFEWEPGTEPREKLTHLEPVPQWFWVRNGPDAPWQYNRGAKAGVYRGEKIEPDAFIIRECERPVNRLALINYVFGNIGKKDWAGFVEVYGIPWIFLVGPPGVPAGKEAEYQAIAEKLIADARGYLPHGADIKTGNAGERGANPFKDFLSWLREEVVLAGTGGKLTMLAESGSGTLAGGAHQDAWDDIVLGEGAKISEVLQCAIDRPHLRKKFPGEPIVAKFEMDFVEEEEATAEFKRKVWTQFQADGTVNDIMANMVSIRELTEQVGLPVNKGYEEPWLPVRDDRGGLITGDTIKDAEGDVIGGMAEEPAASTAEPVQEGTQNNDEDERPPIRPGGRRAITEPVGNRHGGKNRTNRADGTNGFSKAAAEQLGRALAEDFEPLRKRLEKILEIEDPEILANRLGAFLGEIDQLGKDMMADPAAAQVLAAIQTAALFNGMEESKRERK